MIASIHNMLALINPVALSDDQSACYGEELIG